MEDPSLRSGWHEKLCHFEDFENEFACGCGGFYGFTGLVPKKRPANG
jgi:hypothetical protein